MGLSEQILHAAVEGALNADDRDLMVLAALLSEPRAHHWGSEAPARVAERLVSYLQARRTVGYATLKLDLPDLARYLDDVQRSEGIENIRTAVTVLGEHGRRADLVNTMRTAAEMVRRKDNPASTSETVGWLTQQLVDDLAGRSTYSRFQEVGSVTQYRQDLATAPQSVVRIHGSIDPMLRWNGLPVAERDGETLLIAGSSGSGKTALGISIALNVAMQGHTVHYDVIADASGFQIKERMVYQVAGLPLKLTRPLDARLPAKGTRPAETVLERLTWAEQVVDSLPIYINDGGDVDQHELRARLAYKRAHGVRLSVIENLDHMLWDSKEERLERRYQLGRLTQMCRSFDREHGHHTVLLAQSNRSAQEDGDGIPRGHHVADSDQPRRHVTIFIGIFNPNIERGGYPNLDLKARVDKNRSGTTGEFNLPVSLINPELTEPGVVA